ncbi:MAG TPA: DNA repair protein RecO [Tepidisphaeraceae bacterium]|jgi:DNA repair protein RecO (recombination protein O)|nr:DNA repair protein RecO [Tepidisphaeraceae bacterium]
MSLVTDRCLCLRKIPYSETSQILTLFARTHGLLRVIAKGAHRTTKAGASKFGGGIDLLDLADAVFTDHPDRDLATLTEWSLKDGHLDLRRNLRGLYLAQYAAELVSLLIEEHDPHPDLFDHLQTCITNLSTPALEQSFLAFEIELLRETGYLPDLRECTSCGTRSLTNTSRISFSPDRGGVLCSNCESRFPQRLTLDARLLGIMQQFIITNGSPRRLPILTRHQTDPINTLLAEYIEHTLGRRLRLPKYVLGKS